jgi:hypothetical protein
MAISIVSGNRGTATEKVSDQTLAITPLANFAVGNYALLALVIDNTGAGEGVTTDLSVTDTAGNTWIKLREQTESNTTALTGVTCALFLALNTNGLTTGTTINIAIAANSTAKGAGLAELSAAAGFALVLSASGANGSNGAAATTYSVALSGLTNIPGMYIGVTAAEEEVDTAVTLDAAYGEIGFGSINSGTGGLGTSNVRARVGTLSNTSTGDTFDNTGLTSAERATILVRLEEQPIVLDPLLARKTNIPGIEPKAMQAESILAYADVAASTLEPLSVRLIKAHDEIQLFQTSYPITTRADFAPEPLLRLVQAHDPEQKLMRAYSYMPVISEEIPEPPMVAVDIPPISEVIMSGVGW